MQRLLRAAALSAAALGLLAGAGLSGASFAFQTEATPAVSYTEHAASPLNAANLGLNELSDPATEEGSDDIAAPVATHAIAPAFPTEEEPAEREGRTLAELVADYASNDTSSEEAECLARGIYYESRTESLTGQLTVAEVIINRARSGRFASSICGVLRQRGQFSFVRGGVIPAPPANAHWRTAVAIARVAMEDLADGAAPRALFFHARRVNPGWRLTRVATVGNHVFYR
jgi:spore germination cell wall hydrolase CwlJ-like protein